MEQDGATSGYEQPAHQPQVDIYNDSEGDPALEEAHD